MSPGLKAAKVALVALTCIALTFGLIIGAFVTIHKLFGAWGTGLAYLGMLFVIFWCLAMLDLRDKGDGA